ncbi:uncharacterized protein [Rutidosis leptorrhynchoides]|uniref:uncharacterized protein n=1 Tax=Rutidosis leptorrhynchoides TaxID=125765 RepID=UPI003A9A00B0
MPGMWMWTRQPSRRTLTELEQLTAILAEAEINPESVDSWRWSMSEVFVWRAKRKRLPVLMELDKRGINLHFTCYPICDGCVETVDHALLPCNVSLDIWDIFYKWWGIHGSTNLSINEAFRGVFSHQMSSLGDKIWQAVEWTCGYLIWKNQNQKVFSNKGWNPPVTLNEIQVKSFEWIAKRCKSIKIDWHN